EVGLDDREARRLRVGERQLRGPLGRHRPRQADEAPRQLALREAAQAEHQLLVEDRRERHEGVAAAVGELVALAAAAEVQGVALALELQLGRVAALEAADEVAALVEHDLAGAAQRLARLAVAPGRAQLDAGGEAEVARLA